MLSLKYFRFDFETNLIFLFCSHSEKPSIIVDKPDDAAPTSSGNGSAPAVVSPSGLLRRSSSKGTSTKSKDKPKREMSTGSEKKDKDKDKDKSTFIYSSIWNRKLTCIRFFVQSEKKNWRRGRAAQDHSREIKTRKRSERVSKHRQSHRSPRPTPLKQWARRRHELPQLRLLRRRIRLVSTS